MTLEGHENAEVRVLKLIKCTILNPRILKRFFNSVKIYVHRRGWILLVAHWLVAFCTIGQDTACFYF